MFASKSIIRTYLKNLINDKNSQGFETAGLIEQLRSLPDSYDAFFNFSNKLEQLPMQKDWHYVEPDDLEEIMAECDPEREKSTLLEIDDVELRGRIRTAFLSSVCGCILGKPVEVDPTMEELKNAASRIGQWPLDDYISAELLTHLGRRHDQWHETTRGNIGYVATDDDINYSILGMLMLEKYGRDFKTGELRDMWMHNLPLAMTFGPERTTLLKAGLESLDYLQHDNSQQYADEFNPGSELCGALIRMDAYGYAAAGNPELAARLAWYDASFTHRKTGVYASMFTAAAIAAAPVSETPLDIFRTARKYIPQKSRFSEIVDDSLQRVEVSSDWMEGYSLIHSRYRGYTHCQVYQEVGTMINTLKYAENIGHGICIQVSQGNDTDSFGATCGSILGAYFGPEGLADRWLEPFNDRIMTTLADFHETSLTAVADRMSLLPEVLLMETRSETAGSKSKQKRNAMTGVAE